MKVNIEIDCTPAEAREALGLPNVQAMQSSFMKALEERLMFNLDSTSPDALLRSWLALDTQRLQTFAAKTFGGGFGMADKSKRGNHEGSRTG